MEVEKPYRYAHCPYDGAALSVDQSECAAPPACPRCGFVDYGNPKPCVGAIIEHRGQILLARRALEPAKGMWDIPGGFIEARESAEAALAREVYEETGLTAGPATYLGSYPDAYGERSQPTLTLFFELTVDDPRPVHAASDVAELQWFSPDDLPATLAFPHQNKAIKAWLARRR